jgi:hypothetical protein
LRQELKQYLPDYGKELDFDKMNSSYATAVQRGHALHEDGVRAHTPGRNPTTYVFLLTETIRQT